MAYAGTLAVIAIGANFRLWGPCIMSLSQTERSPRVSVVQPAEFNAATAQTPGSLRLSGISAMHGIASSLWAGTFTVEPKAKTGIHHHGQQETVVYVLEGEACVLYGASATTAVTARAGDFLHVPALLPHQEINPSATQPFRWVVVRSTPEPIVVNLPDTFWEDAGKSQTGPECNT